MTSSARPRRTPALGSDPRNCTPLADLAQRPVPAWARGALVTRAPANAQASMSASWLRHGTGVPDGCVLLSWQPTKDGRTDVCARLGLTNQEVLLASWPNLCSNWPRVVHPTVYEVLGLHAALSLAKNALGLANHLLDTR